MSDLVLIDPPSPLAPLEEWEAFRAEMLEDNVPPNQWVPFLPPTLPPLPREEDV